MADALVLAPAANSSTRLFPVSATNRLPSGPCANPVGTRKDDPLTAAEVELLKSVWPITMSGVMRPPWLTGRGYRRTRLLPESATQRLPAPSNTIPCGKASEVLEGLAEPCVSTLGPPDRRSDCPITRSAGSPLRKPTASLQTNTRWLLVSETYRANGVCE